ncbi:hypothetical protein ACIQ34_00230 [Ureibacillus sp. NPDC094379]
MKVELNDFKIDITSVLPQSGAFQRICAFLHKRTRLPKIEKRNILIFYVHGQDLNSDSVLFEKEIQEALDNINEGQ